MNVITHCNKKSDMRSRYDYLVYYNISKSKIIFLVGTIRAAGESILEDFGDFQK